MKLAQRLRQALDPAGEADLLTVDGAQNGPANGTPAAVLIAITDKTEPGVILTVRREHMRTHAGQIAFPGGRIDADEDAIAAALREAQEELLMNPADVDVVGTIDPYCTSTGYCVTPVVGVVPSTLSLTPHEGEVAEWFEAPLAFVLDPANQNRRAALFQGQERHYYEINWSGRRIWGATAAMIVNFSRRLQWS